MTAQQASGHDAAHATTVRDVFTGVSQEVADMLVDALRTVRAGPDETVVQQGADTADFFVVVDGTVEVVRTDDTGREHLVRVLSEGEFFGEVAALRGAPRTASVRTRGPARLLRLPGNTLRQVLAQSEDAAVRLEAVLQAREGGMPY